MDGPTCPLTYTDYMLCCSCFTTQRGINYWLLTGGEEQLPALILLLEERAGWETGQALYSDTSITPSPARSPFCGGLNGPCVYVLDSVLYPLWDVRVSSQCSLDLFLWCSSCARSSHSAYRRYEVHRRPSK
ncbi:hypothetical protein PAXRUDRAFT_822788 [Paxillus rubicundulus Ve08.2h10]|uniref:Uncharacterized protein n=1 Tax=Paxillus rubicundulus Ve08.2h10 TaxID=930991 RepID=A0A0D0DW61_9AGAM|nr:hypothetical protein PAXRUDRAFT_822788 [Paxillus rubicundulus Ve08.2h10]